MGQDRMRLEEENFRNEKHVLLDGQSRGIKNPGVLLDKSQEVFFVSIGEVFPHQ